MLFASFRRPYVLPAELADAVRAHLSGAILSARWKETLQSAEILVDQGCAESLFPLAETRPGGWTNSARGAGILKTLPGEWTVLDALSLRDLEAMPKRGGLHYLGDAFGGFRASQTSTPDGRIPCPRCLILRYVSGRGAHPSLYKAFRSGARLAFPQRDNPGFPSDEGPVQAYGEDPLEADQVLPLPDCADCLRVAKPRSIQPGVFSPVSRLISLGSNHAAHLPEMLWLSGEEKVGSGGCHDDDPRRGQSRAINEVLERYAAHFTPISARPEGIPFQSEGGKRLFSRKRALLTEPGSLSTGLACHRDLGQAIEHGLAEVCERDALARFWFSLCNGDCRVVELDGWRGDRLTVRRFALESYHFPTVLCLGQTDGGNTVTASAAGPLPLAMEKALAECRQNEAYLRTYVETSPWDPPRTFEEHISLYWHGLRKIPDLSRYVVESVETLPLPAPVYHCELTPPDVALLGLNAVRVQVPGLLELPMAHEDWPTVLEEAGRRDTSPPSQPHPFS